MKENILKNRWYYFAVVIILFVTVTPFLPAKKFVATLVSPKETAEVAGEPIIEIADQAERLPTDLFNEQQAGKIAEPAAQLQTKEPPAESTNNSLEDSINELTPGEIKLKWPVTGKIAADYGQGYSAAYGDYRFNQGLNISSSENTQIRAAAPGKVISVGENKLYNKYVIIEHADNFTTFYGNINQVQVAVGQAVLSETVLGTVGRPGYHSLGQGSNLFFQVKWGEQIKDPKEFLPKK